MHTGRARMRDARLVRVRRSSFLALVATLRIPPYHGARAHTCPLLALRLPSFITFITYRGNHRPPHLAVSLRFFRRINLALL